MGYSDCRATVPVAEVRRPFAKLASRTRAVSMALLCAFSCVVVTGCLSQGKSAAGATKAAAHPGAPATDRYKVKAATTAFYTYGPQQPSGPDETLKKDSRVTMVSRSFGYSRVTTSDGKTGYVGTEDIEPLSAEEIADENAALQPQPLPLPPGAVSQGSGGTYTIPPEAGNDERLPLSDPAPTPKPTLTAPFRY
jgi:hypothetical protein